MPYYNDRHTAQWWTPGVFQLHKEKRVVLKCHSYHFKREICSVKLSWLHCLLLLFFLFPQLTACVSTETSAAAVGFERMRTQTHLRSHIRRKGGEAQRRYQNRKSLVTVGGCARMMVPGCWQKERFGMKTVPTPRAEPGSAGCPLIATWAWHFRQILPAECLGRAPHCAERCRLTSMIPWWKRQCVSSVKTWPLVRQECSKLSCIVHRKIFAKRAKRHGVFHDRCPVVM